MLLKIGIAVAIGVVALLVFLVLTRKKRRQKKFVQKSLTHPTGFIKYHPKTKVVVKKALASKPSKSPAKSVAVIQFTGDLRASDREALSHIIDEVILNKEDLSEVVLGIESPGGGVAEYGYAYGEVARIRAAGLKLTVCIDTVAASGGYLMALPANQILAAPFAMVGSIGVVSFVPNVRKLLQKLYVEPRTFTAGEFKRTVTLTDDASPEQVNQYREKLNLIHDQFKQALAKFRPHINLAEVATGDAWLAATSVELKLGLIDGIKQSSDYLLEKNHEEDLAEFSEEEERKGLLRFLKYFVQAYWS